LATTGIIDQL